MDLLKYIGRRVKDGREFRFTYINYRGEFSHRCVKSTLLWFGKTEYHPDDQWLLEGVDMDKMEVRTFAVSEMGVSDEELRKP